jgi:hypothetical protein
VPLTVDGRVQTATHQYPCLWGLSVCCLWTIRRRSNSSPSHSSHCYKVWVPLWLLGKVVGGLLIKTHQRLERRLEHHERWVSYKVNPRNREPGCIYRIEYWIQLNMWIVRVAHFSFITQGQRDSCVLSIEVTLLLQSNSEEIKRISFV